MAFDTNGTKIGNLVDPQVMADLLDVKLTNAIKFAGIADVDTTLVGRAGDTISLPKYAYLGDAVVVNEGADIPIRQLTATSTPVKVIKIGNGVQLSDEAVLSGFGDPIGQAVDQLALSIASKVDNDILASLEGNTATVYEAAGSSITTADIDNALALFGEDLDGEKVLFVSPATYAVIRKATNWLPASEIAAAMIVKGAVGEIFGCQVVVTNRISNGHAYIVKPNAVKVFLKRDTLVETDRDIINKSTVITADKISATYLANDSKAIKIKLQGE